MSFAISDTVISTIQEYLPEGKTILEIGSGVGTIKLAEHYNGISIENNTKF